MMKHTLGKSTKLRMAGFLSGSLCLLAGSIASADSPITAGTLRERMEAQEYGAYLTGVAEGLAYARYEQGGVEAMNCVYDWFFRTEGTIRRIDQAFESFPDHYPGAVMAALVSRECGG